jgi:hypothetical protein
MVFLHTLLPTDKAMVDSMFDEFGGAFNKALEAFDEVGASPDDAMCLRLGLTRFSCGQNFQAVPLSMDLELLLDTRYSCGQNFQVAPLSVDLGLSLGMQPVPSASDARALSRRLRVREPRARRRSV